MRALGGSVGGERRHGEGSKTLSGLGVCWARMERGADSAAVVTAGVNC
jgi:hypothetical protein